MRISLSISDIYFFTSPSGIQLIISASPNEEITSPGRWASGFINPCLAGMVLGWVPFQICVQQLHPPFKMAAVTKNRNFFNCPLLL